MAIVSFRSAGYLAITAVVSYFVFLHEPTLENGELRGKTVLVTGASTGIGEQIAYHYAAHGALVLLVARRKNVLEQVAEKCRKLGAAKAIVIPSDMGKTEDFEKVAQEVAKHTTAGLDQLILNHKAENRLGYWTGSPENMTQLENVFRVNVFGYIALASVLLPQLKVAGGSIGVVGSVAGRANTPYLLPYSASKHALDGFFGGWRIELESSNSPVSITLCTLGLIDTENAIKELKSIGFSSGLERLAASSPNDTALAIVTAVTRKRRELYFPYASTRLPLLFRWWFPALFDKAAGWFLDAGKL